MAQPFYGEIRMFGGNFAPVGWAFCNGQEISIAGNDVLFTLIGTTYGGDGQQTFRLPDLRGRVPLHMGNSFTIGELGGTENVTLTTNQMPAHTHIPIASSTSGGSDNPLNNVWGASTLGKPYGLLPAGTALNPAAISTSGGNQPHDNMVPFLVISYIICTDGIFPAQN